MQPPPYLSPSVTPGQILCNQFQIVRVLGEGAFGAVYDAVDLEAPGETEFPGGSQHQTHYAVKCMRHQPSRSRRALFQARELALHGLVSSHPNIVTLHRVISCPSDSIFPCGRISSRRFDDRDTIYMVMQLSLGRDLYSRISQREFVGQDSKVKRLFVQLLDAVEWCHDKGVYHRDLKPENVLLDEDDHVLLADFGMASSEERSAEFGCGSKPYMSPESIGESSRQSYCHRTSDIWALGIILTNMLTSCSPWRMAYSRDPWYRAFLADPRWLYKAFDISEEAAELLGDVLDPDPETRISLALLRRRVQGISSFFSDPGGTQKECMVEPVPLPIPPTDTLHMMKPAQQKVLSGGGAQSGSEGVQGRRLGLPRARRRPTIAE